MQRCNITTTGKTGSSSDAYVKSITGYDAWGNPIDFIDEDGMLWIYQGKNDGNDYWAGYPDYD